MKQHEGITATYASTYPLAKAIQARLAEANPLTTVEVRPALGIGYDVVMSVERCTGLVGTNADDAERCDQQAVLVDVDRESARCNECLNNDALGGRATRPIRMLN